MGSPDLAELRERVDFCRQEIIRLADDLRTFSARHFETQIVLAEEFPMRALQGRLTLPIPVACRSRAGTTINELRACLDGLACRLAERNGETAERVYFPISGSIQQFGSDGRKKIKKLNTADQEKIASLTPYKGGDDLLYALHEADKKRKHNILNATGGTNAGAGIRDGKTDVFIWHGAVELGPNWKTLVRVGPDTRLNMNLKFEVVFSEPAEIAGQPIIEVLSHFADKVTAIIDMFDNG